MARRTLRKGSWWIVAMALVLVPTVALATFTQGWFKNRGLSSWDEPTDFLVTTGAGSCGGTGFYAGEVFPLQVVDSLTFLQILQNADAKDATYNLAAKVIVGALNEAAGSCPAFGGNIGSLTTLGAFFLLAFPVGSDPQGADREFALDIANCLDLHFNIDAVLPTVGFDYTLTEAYACAQDLL